MGAVLKDEITEAFSECKALNDVITEKEKEFKTMSAEIEEKHPLHLSYLSELSKINDMKKLDYELTLCNDAIKLLTAKKELLMNEVVENKNLYNVLHTAMK